MKITTSKPAPAFQPVTVSITFQSQKELDTLTAVASRTRKIPDVIFHSGYDSKAVDSLLARDIYPEDVEGSLQSLRDVLLGAGGKP